jgi:hypothetical protein
MNSHSPLHSAQPPVGSRSFSTAQHIPILRYLYEVLDNRSSGDRQEYRKNLREILVKTDTNSFIGELFIILLCFDSRFLFRRCPNGEELSDRQQPRIVMLGVSLWPSFPYRHSRIAVPINPNPLLSWFGMRTIPLLNMFFTVAFLQYPHILCFSNYLSCIQLSTISFVQ